MSNYKKLGGNIALLSIGSFSSRLLVFLLVPLYTNILTTSQYGIADMIVITVNLLAPFFSVQINEAVMRYSLDKQVNNSQVFTIGLSTITFGFLILFFLSPIALLSDLFRPYYGLFLLYYLSFVVYNFILHFVKGIEQIKAYTMGGIISTVLLISFNVIFLVILDYGINGYMLSMILSNSLTSFYLFYKSDLRRYIIPIKEINQKLLKEMYRYSTPLIPNSISWWISNSADRYLLTFFCGVSITGVYSISYKIPTVMSIISSIFISAWQISAVEEFGGKGSKEFFSSIYNKFSSFNIIIATFSILLTKPAAKLIYANNFYDAWQYSIILILAFMFHALSGFLGTIYMSAKETKMILFSTIFAAAVNIILNLLLIPKFDGMGAAFATLISFFVIWLIRLVDSRKILTLELNLKTDLLSYSLLAVQLIMILTEMAIFQVPSILISLLILFLNRKIIYVSLNIILEYMRKRKNKV